jgi:lysosomal Pro-X carboxypeptidase
LNGPLFFYTGNEGSIEGFAKNTGIMFDLAPQFNALIVFCEHRFYGTSLPFGPTSFDKIENARYLNIEQALRDYVNLIDYLRDKKGYKFSKVIAFGGSCK